LANFASLTSNVISGARPACVPLDAPLQRRGELVERDERFVEHAGEFETAAEDAELGVAAFLGRVEHDGRVAQAGPPDRVRLRRRLGLRARDP
jgi:hypothetical protein